MTPKTHIQPYHSIAQAPQAYLAEPVNTIPPPSLGTSQALIATPAMVYDPLWYPDCGASNHLTLNSSVYNYK